MKKLFHTCSFFDPELVHGPAYDADWFKCLRCLRNHTKNIAADTRATDEARQDALPLRLHSVEPC